MNPVLMNREPVDCVLVRLSCERCGPVRMALADSPDDQQIECPYCTTESKFEQLGRGKTTRLLPYFELEANLQQLGQKPPGGGEGFRRLVRGQTVVFCEETNILHFATINEVWTNAANISAEGMPSISFIIRGLDTGPIPHVSGSEGNPPFWCSSSEFRHAAVEVADAIATGTTKPPGKAAAKKKTAKKAAASKVQ